jgi:hypothetical protein
MSYDRYTPKEIADRGEQLYRQHIQRKIGDDDHGKFVVIDIETGDYEIANDDLTATTRALAKRPNAVLYGLRIGYPAAYRLGGRATRVEE